MLPGLGHVPLDGFDSIWAIACTQPCLVVAQLYCLEPCVFTRVASGGIEESD